MKKLFGLTLALVLCSMIGRAKPAHAFTCAEICGADYTSCRTDCRFTPYQGCQSDCSQEYSACLSHC
jgi:hypothetical protein